MRDKRAHDAGYRYTWPPTMGNLTPRQRNKIEIWNHAEAYIQHQQREQQQNGGSLSHQNYDTTGSRADFEDKWS